MPEGPSLVILREEAQRFKGQRVVAVEGNAKIDQQRLVGQQILALRTWGKHFLIQFRDFTVRIHLLMFGRYCINERKPDKAIRLGLRVADGQELNFYACAARYIEGDLDETYDWRADVMSDAWDPAAARRKLRSMPDVLICDALLDQEVFAGVGNIIKNEVLFRTHVDPCSKVGAIPAAKLREVTDDARTYSFQFLEWKRAYVLRKHWLVHNKGMCPRCEIKLTRAYLGTRDRRSFFCTRCQIRYELPQALTKSKGASKPTTVKPAVIAAAAAKEASKIKKATRKQPQTAASQLVRKALKQPAKETHAVVKGASSRQTAASRLSAKRPVTKRPIAKRPTAKRLVTKRPSAERPTAKRSVVKPAAKSASIRRTAQRSSSTARA